MTNSKLFEKLSSDLDNIESKLIDYNKKLIETYDDINSILSEAEEMNRTTWNTLSVEENKKINDMSSILIEGIDSQFDVGAYCKKPKEKNNDSNKKRTIKQN